MTRLTTAVLTTLLLACAGTASASSAIAVASARVIRATMVTTDPLVKQLSVSTADLQHGYISLEAASLNKSQAGRAFSVRVEIPSMQSNTSFSGDAGAKPTRIALTGTEASLRQNPFAYITYDGQ
jgi:hypothetical protein